MDKKQEMLDYFDKTIFEPAIKYSEETGIKEIAQGTRYTKMRMSQLSPEKILQYFWSSIIGTEKSIRFAELLKEHNVIRFEDIIDEVRVKFNDDYFRGE